ncbi:hypothetical protein ACQ3HE_06810 [Plantibacter auratus]|uniref:hypothetical protein n=1 Tax=Plantibacter auratus TaxID=272914 RepID=UPI003D324BFE
MNEIALPNNLAAPASQGAMVEQSRAIAEVAAAVGVARQFPRDTNRAVDQMRELCGRLAIANRAFYSVPNRGSGLSVHIARELSRIFGNVDYGVRELNRDDARGESEMQAWAWDVETNVRSTRSFIVPHAKSTKAGRKALTDLNDIYLNNQNVAARAVRECVFSILPGWFLADAETILKQTIERGDGKPIEQRRTDALDVFASLKVTEKQLTDKLGKPVGQWGPRDIAELTKAYSSITQDGIPASEFFPEQAVTVGGQDA